MTTNKFLLRCAMCRSIIGWDTLNFQTPLLKKRLKKRIVENQNLLPHKQHRIRYCKQCIFELQFINWKHRRNLLTEIRSIYACKKSALYFQKLSIYYNKKKYIPKDLQNLIVKYICQ